MAVSHQWYMQWWPSSVVVANINQHSGYVVPSKQYTWNEFLHEGTNGATEYLNFNSAKSYVKPDYTSDSSDDGRKRGDDAKKVLRYFPQRQKGRHEKNYNSGLAGATLWLSMLGLTHTQIVPSDTDTPPFSTLYKWKYLDYEFSSPKHRRHAIKTGKYIAENVLPLGIEVWSDRVWVTMPNWKTGVPATLATVSRSGGIVSPALKPYPDWSYHDSFGKNCSNLTSVFRVNVDNCGRLWVLDTGTVNAANDEVKQLCPPSILVFDLNTDALLARYDIPDQYVLQNSLFTNIIVDSRTQDCSDLHLYIADTWRFGLIVFRASDALFWRFSHHLFYPDPIASNYTLHGLNFQWTDGIFGLALSPVDNMIDRVLYFHSMSSSREVYVYTSILRDPSRVKNSANDFILMGEGRGKNGQVSASAIDKRGVMFYGLVTQDSVGCWDISKPYLKRTTGVVVKNSDTLVFPNDIKIDSETQQSVWVITNRLPMFQAGLLNLDDYNYRILFADTTEAVRSTICDPEIILQSRAMFY